MKTPLTQQTAAYVVAALLVAYPSASSVATTSPREAFSATLFQAPPKKAEAPMLVRNSGTKSVETAAKADKLATAPAPIATAKGKKIEDRKAVGRCWQRLMNTVREVNNAHRAKKKSAQ